MDLVRKVKQKRKVKINKKKCDLLVIRIGRDGKLKHSKPCSKCIDCLVKANLNIKDIYYSGPNGEVIHTKLNSLINAEQHISHRFIGQYP